MRGGPPLEPRRLRNTLSRRWWKREDTFPFTSGSAYEWTSLQTKPSESSTLASKTDFFDLFAANYCLQRCRKLLHHMVSICGLKSTNSIIHVTLNIEFDSMCLYPPNAQIAKSGRLFFVRFEGNSFCPKMAKLDFLP